MRISTWNVNSVNARIEHLEKFIKKDQSDIYLLQELKKIYESNRYIIEYCNCRNLHSHLCIFKIKIWWKLNSADGSWLQLNDIALQLIAAESSWIVQKLFLAYFSNWPVIYNSISIYLMLESHEDSGMCLHDCLYFLNFAV